MRKDKAESLLSLPFLFLALSSLLGSSIRKTMRIELHLSLRHIIGCGVACFLVGALVGGLFGAGYGLSLGTKAMTEVRATHDKALADVANVYRNESKLGIVSPPPTTE